VGHLSHHPFCRAHRESLLFTAIVEKVRRNIAIPAACSTFTKQILFLMKGTFLGEFEELVLLTVAALYDQAYGLAVLEELRKHSGRSVSIGAMHSALERLEQKGFLQSRYGEATAERGGRRKRFFTVTGAGEKALRESRQLRNGLWDLIPKAAFGGGAL
jgi:DNA-binding PadR family transcriptional regulator